MRYPKFLFEAKVLSVKLIITYLFSFQQLDSYSLEAVIVVSLSSLIFNLLLSVLLVVGGRDSHNVRLLLRCQALNHSREDSVLCRGYLFVRYCL